MNTILVNCSKEKAEVSDENGRFLNRVANGIKIEVGDEISVEQIAVNSIGVGADIIEIPSQILDYTYLTNKMTLKSAFYIHHNYEYTCAMPLAEPAGGGTMGDIGIGINTDAKSFETIIPRWENVDFLEKQSGRRYYLIDAVTNAADIIKFPANSWWDFLETEIPIEVDIGYDNPSNLAGKITEELKSTDIHSASALINTRYVAPVLPPVEIEPNVTNSVNRPNHRNSQFSISSPDGIIQTRPVNFTNTKYLAGELMYSGLATQNPFLWRYGSRLINAPKPAIFSPELGSKVVRPVYNLAAQKSIPDERWVYNLYDLEVDAAGTQNVWGKGYVIPTNLTWNVENVEMLQKFILSQSTYGRAGGVPKFTNSKAYVNQISEVKDNQFWNLRFGRTNDYLIPTDSSVFQQGLWSPITWNAGAVPDPTLAAPLPAGATPPPNTFVENQSVYFKQDLWDNRYLGQSASYGNALPSASINTDRPYKTSLADATAPLLVVDGIGNLNPESVAKYFDLNITAVRISGVDTGVATSLQTTTVVVPLVPAVPDSYDLQTYGANDGSVAMVSDFDVVNNVIPLVLGGGQKQFVDDGGTAADYSTSHFRHTTFDAGAGNAVWISFIKYAFEASSFAHYDRLYITASDNLADLNTPAGLLNNTKSPTLSPKLYQTTSTAVSSGLGDSYVATNGGYGTGGGWVVPTESGEAGVNDMEGNNNASWLNTFFKINCRYVRFYFESDGSSVDTGWEIRLAPEIFTAGSAEIPATTTTTTTMMPTIVGDVNDDYVIGITMNAETLPVQTLPNVPIRAGNYMLVDLGMTQVANSCVQLLNPQTHIVVNTALTATPIVFVPSDAATIATDYINQIQVGSPNALFLFEPNRGRFGFQDLHWKKYTGNGMPETTAAAPPPISESGSVAINSYNRTIERFINPNNKDFGAIPDEYYPYFEYTGAESGVGLLDMGLYSDVKTALNSPTITYLKTLNRKDRVSAYKGSLLDRFGFEYSFLFNELGFPEVYYNSKYYATSIPTAFPQFYPSPLTTNNLFDTAIALNMDYNANSAPNFGLNFMNGFANLNSSSASSTIYATNLPQKLVFPFWLIHSDIIGGIEFHSENQGSTSNIVAICNRAYTSGDFAFSFATDYTFTATKEYVISGITTQILNPDLTPADVDERTSIVYKIQKRIPMFNAPRPEPKKPEDFVDKPAKDRKVNDALQMPSVFSLT